MPGNKKKGEIQLKGIVKKNWHKPEMVYLMIGAHFYRKILTDKKVSQEEKNKKYNTIAGKKF